jgi:hypothetical protein
MVSTCFEVPRFSPLAHTHNSHSKTHSPFLGGSSLIHIQYFPRTGISCENWVPGWEKARWPWMVCYYSQDDCTNNNSFFGNWGQLGDDQAAFYLFFKMVTINRKEMTDHNYCICKSCKCKVYNSKNVNSGSVLQQMMVKSSTGYIECI